MSDEAHHPRSGPPPAHEGLVALVRVVSRQPVVDAVRLALYRPEFYGGGALTHEAMRGPSAWSIGDRELMAAFVSKVNECQFCIAAHSATSGLWYGDHAKVAATLADVETAPIDEPLRATLRMVGKLTGSTALTGRHARRVGRRRFPGRSRTRGRVLAFNITERLADAFDFTVASPEAMEAVPGTS